MINSYEWVFREGFMEFTASEFVSIEYEWQEQEGSILNYESSRSKS